MSSKCNDNVYDTFEHIVNERIGKTLNHHEFKTLENNEWSEIYIKYFLSMYAQICDLPGFRYHKHDLKTIEPVTLHVDHTQNKAEDPVMLHSISIPFLKWLFNSRCYKSANNSFRCGLKMPSVFPLINNFKEIQNTSNVKLLNSFVSNKLLLYYVYADHAAYHYLQFKATGNADYDHKNIINRPSNIKPNNVKHCHDIITYNPSKTLSKYLQAHDVLKIDSQEHSKSYMDKSYSDLFDQSDDDSD